MSRRTNKADILAWIIVLARCHLYAPKSTINRIAANSISNPNLLLEGCARATLRIRIDLDQLHETPFIIICLRPLGMADTVRRLDVDGVLVGRAESGILARWPTYATCRVRGIERAAQEPREDACKTEPYGGHAYAGDADFCFDHRPKRGFEVVPGHVCRLGEVHEGAKT